MTTKLKDLAWQGFELSELNKDARSRSSFYRVGIVENEVEGRSQPRKIFNKLVKKQSLFQD
ncbi:hypothetical protein [Microcoleus sp. OTE_8_concoct_300]|uniref:hypothetical protein n=1 Tax=Microcoleus sp. OTE_8_concoct_300 TaxID=2964710 RepID=UPI00403F374E